MSASPSLELIRPSEAVAPRPIGVWTPIDRYEIDERTGEGPEVLLAWTNPKGEVESGTGTGFRHFDDEANRDMRLFASGGRVRRTVTHFQPPALSAWSRPLPRHPIDPSIFRIAGDMQDGIRQFLYALDRGFFDSRLMAGDRESAFVAALRRVLANAEAHA